MNHKELLKIKYVTYLNTRTKVENIFGSVPNQLIRYQKTYEKELGTLFAKWKSVHDSGPSNVQARKKLLAELAQSNLVFVGDFHAQPQSARSFFRLIRSSKSKTVAVNLECFKQTDQSSLTLYMKGELSEKDFLHKVKWKNSWGFPFETMRPLLKWCQAHSIPVFGVNTETGVHDLKSRDRMIAKALSKNFMKEPQRTHFLLIGDFHISPSHLPREFKKLLPKQIVTTVYQSPEEIYFELAKRRQEQTDVVNLAPRRWVMMTVSPWVKWQEYLIFLESDFDKKIKSADLDLAEYVGKEVDFILQFLGIKNSVAAAGAISVYSPVDQEFYNKISFHRQSLGPKLKAQIDFLINEGSSFYLPEIKTGFLSRTTINHISRISAVVALNMIGQLPKSIPIGKVTFLQMIWLEMIIYFFSKLINPKKKSDTLNDIRQALQKEGFDDRGKESLTLALEQKLGELQILSLGRKPKSIKRHYRTKSYKVASEILGGILGEKLYFAFRKNRIQKATLTAFLTQDFNDRFFEQKYYESIEIIDSWPSSFSSKYDHF